MTGFGRFLPDMDRTCKEVYFSLGANIGNRRQNMEAAIRMRSAAVGRGYGRISSFVETDPWGFESEDKFLNCVVVYSLDMPCREILGVCKAIESRLGRDVSEPKFDEGGKRIYESRAIDIDILFCGEETVDEPDLKVPHHLMRERDFVMVPLREVADGSIVSHFPEIFY